MQRAFPPRQINFAAPDGETFHDARWHRACNNSQVYKPLKPDEDTTQRSPQRKEPLMFKHPRYLDIPWEMHWHPEDTSGHHWWLMLLVIVAALFLIGVGVTSGLW